MIEYTHPYAVRVIPWSSVVFGEEKDGSLRVAVDTDYGYSPPIRRVS